jgi:hypothetical protein
VRQWKAVLRAIALGGAFAGMLAVAPAQAQIGRLLLSSSVTDREDHVDLTIEFACTLVYQTHLPAAEGAELRVTLQPGTDCGIAPQAPFPTERQLPADDVGLVRSIELSPGVAGGAELTLQWNRIEKFVLAPTAGMRGLRVRVIRQKKSNVQVLVDDDPGTFGSYAVNLKSSLEPIPTAEIARARTLLKVPVYVSDSEVNGQTWHRLRAGPFFSQSAAEKLLREAQKSYTDVWLGIDDEEKAPDATRDDRVPAAGARTPLAASAETRPDPALEALLDQARRASAKKRYDEAIPLLEKILLNADFVHRVDAQELLGIVRERNKQLAHAKAEYEEYLRRYPDGKAADRVRARLKALRQAALPGHRGTGGGGADDGGWRLYGSVDQTYRRDNSQITTTTQSRDFVSQNALLNDVDFVARRRGERYDFTSRISVGYMKDFMPDGQGDQQRVSVAYAELRDREFGWGAKIGRQSRGMAGIFGTFDGLLGNWQARPHLGFSVVAGLPVETSRAGLDTHREFVGVAADYSTKNNAWDTSVYAITQQYYGLTDRQSVGVETRYFRPGRTLVALVDYDLHFSDVNNAMLLGTLLLPSQWTINASAGRQRSPTLSLRNALIGQTVTTFADLQQQFTPAQIEQFAKDRSGTLTQGNFAVTHPLGDRAQWTLSAYTVNISGTPASGGVEAIPAFGVDSSLSAEVLVNSLLKAGDANTVALRYEQGGGANTYSLGVSNRLPIGDAWRLTSRLRADHRQITSTGTLQWLYAPSLRLDWLHKRGQIELESGAEFGDRTTNGFTERDTRFFISLGYRLSLDSATR